MTATEVDVLIIGGGSAGLCVGVWLARTGISYRILERRPGMLVNGQADGVQVRTVEIFESFGISEELLKEAYHALEDTFWSDDDNDKEEEEESGRQRGERDEVAGTIKGIRRTYSTPDTEAGLSHLPHVILNQARINALLTDEMVRASGATSIEYGCDVRDLVVDSTLADDPDAHCVTVTAVKDGVEQVYKAKYALVRGSFAFSSSSTLNDAISQRTTPCHIAIFNTPERAATEHTVKSASPLALKWWVIVAMRVSLS